ncbi:MAG: hypothetical protein F4066_07665 [Chloroflexi bacterium]|nr:hypothetical protein [Chloroflexota bacterium]MYB22820.1 hypothetical protein [Chloroflexota bacterium]MYD15677.1 hypothetical protein [Chloroflexota bacterium]MYF82399.1 hypothetical protein [Chloroflexota bacterium]MYI04725.1 hypothetical protein [Chloroflexota bacterium]
MANEFASQLRAELKGIDSELSRLENKRRLIQELLDSETGSAPSTAQGRTPGRRAARRGAGAAQGKRQRRPRGLITGKVREFLGQQTQPVHATEILAYLEKNDAAPQSAKPMPTLQSTLQRMKEMGEIENRGRNRWSLVSSGNGSQPAAAPAPARTDGPPIVRSTTTFGSRPPSSQ